LKNYCNEYFLNFKSWQCFDLISNAGIKYYTTNTANNCQNIKSPLFIFVSFKTNKISNQEKDPCEFGHCNYNVKNNLT